MIFKNFLLLYLLFSRLSMCTESIELKSTKLSNWTEWYKIKSYKVLKYQGINIHYLTSLISNYILPIVFYCHPIRIFFDHISLTMLVIGLVNSMSYLSLCFFFCFYYCLVFKQHRILSLYFCNGWLE